MDRVALYVNVGSVPGKAGVHQQTTPHHRCRSIYTSRSISSWCHNTDGAEPYMRHADFQVRARILRAARMDIYDAICTDLLQVLMS